MGTEQQMGMLQHPLQARKQVVQYPFRHICYVTCFVWVLWKPYSRFKSGNLLSRTSATTGGGASMCGKPPSSTLRNHLKGGHLPCTTSRSSAHATYPNLENHRVSSYEGYLRAVGATDALFKSGPHNKHRTQTYAGGEYNFRVFGFLQGEKYRDLFLISDLINNWFQHIPRKSRGLKTCFW